MAQCTVDGDRVVLVMNMEEAIRLRTMMGMTYGHDADGLYQPLFDAGILLDDSTIQYTKMSSKRAEMSYKKAPVLDMDPNDGR